MSIRQMNYVMVGVDLTSIMEELDIDELDTWLEEMDQFTDDNNLTFVFDGMSGEYAYIGEVLNKGDEDGMSIKSVNIDRELISIRENVKSKLINMIEDEPKLISFSHWV